MSLVVVVTEERLRPELEELALEAGYHVALEAELGAGVAEGVDQLVARFPDLLLVASQRHGQGWGHALDAAGTRYWLLAVGSLDGPTLSGRRPHRQVLELNPDTTAYLGQLLDDWRDRAQIRVDCFTFAYREGLPEEADWVIDTRFLDSPYWVKDMRERPGTDPDVRRYVMGQPGAERLIEHFLPVFIELMPLYHAQQRSVLRVAVGCTGGRHRSVAMAAELVERINGSGQAVARHLTEPPLHLPRQLD
ncbi:MAG: RapZ C-terminal domain-containing protein [Candidatus Dormibacteria bacterium]